MAKIAIEVDVDLQDLIPQFIENRKQDIESLEALVMQNDLEAISQLAHKIKGTAAGYGFSELSELASRMELFAKNGESLPLPELVRKMRAHFSNIEVHFVSM